ncbi:MAG: RidA family protein [Acidobacteriota bacterium]
MWRTFLTGCLSHFLIPERCLGMNSGAVCTLVWCLVGTISPAWAQTGPLRAIGPVREGRSAAVIVDDVPFIQTTQLFAADSRGRIRDASNAGKQSRRLIQNLEGLLKGSASGLKQLVRVNLYAVSNEDLDTLRQELARLLAGSTLPAVTGVVTELPFSEAAVALDALAVASRDEGQNAVRYHHLSPRQGALPQAQTALLPAGPKVYVSGQYAKGGFEAATRGTMEGLAATLRHLGLNWENVVQLKAFLYPMSRSAEAWNIMASEFKARTFPPISFVEWDPNLPIEIEMVVSGTGLAESFQHRQPVSFVTPPGLDKSPVFSRIAITHGGKSVFVSGIYSESPGDPELEVRDVFSQLRSLLKEAGTDLEHLAKATYYVGNETSSRLLGSVRQELYNPQRPPAASKALVKGVGKEDRALTLDMIAVLPHP